MDTASAQAESDTLRKQVEQVTTELKRSVVLAEKAEKDHAEFARMSISVLQEEAEEAKPPSEKAKNRRNAESSTITILYHDTSSEAL